MSIKQLLDKNISDQNSIDENSNRYRRLKRALFGDPSGKIRTFAIISPENPLGYKDSDEEEFKERYKQYTKNPKLYNDEKLKKMKAEMLVNMIKSTGDTALKYGAFNYIQLLGSYGDRERTFMIFNLTIDDAKTIARDYGQDSFFFAYVSKDPNEHPSTIAYYKTYTQCKSYTLVEISRTITFEDEADDFFSKYGFKYKINMKTFGNDVEPIENDGMFEESFTRPTFSSRASARRDSRMHIDEN